MLYLKNNYSYNSNRKEKGFMRTLTLLKTLVFIPYLIFASVMTHAQQIRTGIWNGVEIEYVDGQINVKATESADFGSITDVIQAHNGELLKEFDKLRWGLAQFREGTDIFPIIEELLRNVSVEVAEPNMVTYLSYDPNDPYFRGTPPATYAHQWALWNFGQIPPGGTRGADINVRKAWDITLGSSDVLVAVLDTGIPLDSITYQLSHPELNDAARILLGPDFIYPAFRENNPTVRDSNGHGTHVTGILAAETDNEVGIAGVAGRSKVLVIQVFSWGGRGTMRAFYNGVLYAVDNSARIINFSGVGPYSSIMESAVRYARDKDVLIVAAAGNSGCAAVSSITYPARFSPTYGNVIAVGSTDQNDQRSSFSSCGSELNIVAPGGGWWEADPKSPTQAAEYIFSTLPNYYYQGLSQNYGYNIGTSMATPHVAGIASLILSVHPSLKPPEVRDILQRTAEDKGPPGFDVEYGWGRVNAYQAVLLALAYSNKSVLAFATWSNSARHLLKGGGKLHEQFTSGGEIFYRRSSNNGISWELTKRISLGNGSNSGGCLAVAQASSVHLVWQRQIASDRYEVWYSRSADNGSSWTNPAVLPDASEVKVSAYQTGGPMPVIAEGRFDRGNKLFLVFCSSTGLRYRVSENDGATWYVPDDESISGQYNDRVRSPSLAGGRHFFSLTYDYAGVVTGLWSRIHDGRRWSNEKDVQDGTGSALGEHPSVAIDADKQPIAAWSAMTSGLEIRRILLRQGGSDNSWGKWFVEFGAGGNLIDWHYPSLTYYNRDRFGAYGVAIVNHTSTNAVKLIKYNGDELDPPWSIETASESGAWANISAEGFSSGKPTYLWTDQSGSPYQIVLGSDGVIKSTANELSHSRRVVIRHKPTNGALSLEVSRMAIVTAAGDTLPLPFKRRPLRDSTNITLSNVWEYLGTAMSLLPTDARWLVMTRSFVASGPMVLPRNFSLRVLGPGGAQLAVLDTGSVSGTLRLNIASFAGRTIIIRASLNLIGVPASAVSLCAGDVYLLEEVEAKSKLAAVQELPSRSTISQNYPNPFNPSTIISFQLPVSSFVTLKVYNVLGQEVTTLVNEEMKPGSYEVMFDAFHLPSGVYFYRISAGSYVEIRKLILMK